MNEVQDILGRYQTNTSSPLFKLGMDTPTVESSPIVGLNGYSGQPTQQTQQSSSLPGVFSSVTTPSGTTQAPSSNIGPSAGIMGRVGGGNSSYDSNSGTTSTNPGGANTTGLGNAVSALGMLGRITKDPTINQIAGIAGAGYGALNGNYTSLGGYLGGALTGSPYGALAGALTGNYFSPDTSTTKFALNAALGLGIPGYGMANALSGGWLGGALLGTDAQRNALNQTTIAAVPGILGNFGWNNNNANTTQQDFRASEIASQNSGGNSGRSYGNSGTGNTGGGAGSGSGPAGGGTGSSHFG
jgi:hypothetical protein